MRLDDFQQKFPLVGQFNVASLAAHQGGLQLLFECANLLPYRGGGKPQFPGGHGKARLGRGHTKAAQLRQLDILVAVVVRDGCLGKKKDEVRSSG